LFGTVRIIEANGTPVKSNSARVRVLDISVGGMRFASKLKFPVGRKIILEMLVKIDETDFRLKGFVVHRSRIQKYGYEYGLCFIRPEQRLRGELIAIFGKSLIRHGRYFILLNPDNESLNK